ncbi:flagellar biosynthesis anti-sigma factor FlgM [Shewanella sp. Isolate11]|uniref:flagellar biosynthesis anti-sigma factor FlgM n=1 Tax=Shewanella sp. Isolate11 TaxID=2908530 RepID=UPI001EFEF0C4|nr:flagellar biosynthesis anti-sigma factor FlgM [Shewanella sp. Isolate11]MCG9697178.1 flagellar biosynthesis anti-sigma factor FlgM [Shewanella sp. Isolate11]
MAIDIKQVNSGINSRSASLSNGKSAAAKTATDSVESAAQTVKKDSVSITSAAQQLQNVQAKLNDIPEIDLKKVEEIKTAIAEGRYKVDPEKLASNIAQFESELKDLN